MSKKEKIKIEPAYWCTCSDNPPGIDNCLGCAVDNLVFKVMGDIGLRFLKNRTYSIRKGEKK